MKLVTRIAMALVALAPWLAGAQGPYPNKPVKVVVSTVPGPLDAFARIICEKLATSLKQPFVVENKAGAGGNIAAEYVKGQPADGYTLLFSIDTTFTVNPGLYKSLPFDPVKDFAVISVPVTYGQMLTVNPTVPVRNVKELVTLARQKPLTYASGGNGSPSHLVAAYFLSTAVGGLPLHVLGGDVAAGAGLVLDHERLLERRGELLADDARERIERTRHRAHDHFHGLVGIRP